MKFLEGKSDSERKKAIAAIVLGAITVCALFYTFVLSGSGNRTVVSNKNGNANSSNRTLANSNRSANGGQQITEVQETPVNDILLQEIPNNPFPPIDDGGTSRNIFAFYEPPPPRPAGEVIPVPVVQKPTPTPTPVPPPDMFVGFVNPAQVFAQTGNFQLEVGGDKFTPDSQVFFNGVQVQTQFTGPQRLVAQIPAQLVSSEGQRQISVQKPNCVNTCSNVAVLNVQAPPIPDFSFVGLVARKRNNNDTAMLQNKKTKEYINVRLNDPVPDRFRVFSISSDKVVVVDTALKLRHTLPFVDEKNAGRAGVAGGGGIDRRGSGNTFNPNPNADMNYQNQPIPGIPDSIPRYIPPQPMIQPQPAGRNDKDEDDDDPNR